MDIVERLRELGFIDHPNEAGDIALEAANEIERLREAINKVIKKMEGKGMGDWHEAKILAKALKEDK